MEEKKEQAKQEENTQDLKTKIIQVLKTCYDPEIPVDIYELGLIYDISIDDSNNVYIKMTLTSPACPAATFLPGQVEDRVRALPEVNEVKVDVVWEPPWNPDMMSDVARFELGMM